MLCQTVILQNKKSIYEYIWIHISYIIIHIYIFFILYVYIYSHIKNVLLKKYSICRKKSNVLICFIRFFLLSIKKIFWHTFSRFFFLFISLNSSDKISAVSIFDVLYLAPRPIFPCLFHKYLNFKNKRKKWVFIQNITTSFWRN